MNQYIKAFTLTAQGAATLNGGEYDNQRGRSAIVVIDITAITGTGPSLVVTVEGYDPLSGKYYTILASAALAAVATTVLRIDPDLTAAANTIAKDIMPAHFRVKAVVAGTTPAVTATISVHLIN